MGALVVAVWLSVVCSVMGRLKLKSGMTWGNLAYGMKHGGGENGTHGYQVLLLDPDFDTQYIEEFKKTENGAVLCYLSVGTLESYRPYFKNQIKADKKAFKKKYRGLVMGRMRHFRDEKYFDVRKIDKLMPIMKERMVELKEKGCDAIETDNVDCYQARECGGQWKNKTRRYKLRQSAQYAIRIAETAHELGMPILLKNSLSMYNYPGILDVYDGASVESCVIYGECEILSVWGMMDRLVIGSEYRNQRSCKPGNYPSNVMMKYCGGNRGRWLCKDRVKTWNNCFNRLEGPLPRLEYLSPDAENKVTKRIAKVVDRQVSRIESELRRDEFVELHPVNIKKRKSVWDRTKIISSNQDQQDDYSSDFYET